MAVAEGKALCLQRFNNIQKTFQLNFIGRTILEREMRIDAFHIQERRLQDGAKLVHIIGAKAVETGFYLEVNGGLGTVLLRKLTQKPSLMRCENGQSNVIFHRCFQQAVRRVAQHKQRCFGICFLDRKRFFHTRHCQITCSVRKQRGRNLRCSMAVAVGLDHSHHGYVAANHAAHSVHIAAQLVQIDRNGGIACDHACSSSSFHTPALNRARPVSMQLSSGAKKALCSICGGWPGAVVPMLK